MRPILRDEAWAFGGRLREWPGPRRKPLAEHPKVRAEANGTTTQRRYEMQGTGPRRGSSDPGGRGVLLVEANFGWDGRVLPAEAPRFPEQVGDETVARNLPVEAMGRCRRMNERGPAETRSEAILDRARVRHDGSFVPRVNLSSGRRPRVARTSRSCGRRAS